LSHLDEGYEELIQREIDGDTSEQEKTALKDYVAANAEAQSLHAGLKKLTEVLNRVEPVKPPADLAKSILAALSPRRHAQARVLRPRSWLARYPILKFGYAIAAGLILGLLLHPFLFNQTSTLPATDVQGSMIPRLSGDQMLLNLDGGSGSVTLRVSDSIASLEFDLDSREPARLEVGFDKGQVEFKGFNQQTNSVDSFAAEPGRIVVQCEGKHRFIVLLANQIGFDANLNIGVSISGRLVQSGIIRLPKLS
jgi:hypothetical protein